MASFFFMHITSSNISGQAKLSENKGLRGLVQRLPEGWCSEAKGCTWEKKSLLCHWWDSRYLLPKFSQESKNQPQQKKNEGLRRSGLALFHHSHTIFLSEPQREIWVLLYWSEALPRQPQRPIWPFCCGKDDCRDCLCLLHIIVVLWVYKWLWFWVYNIKKLIGMVWFTFYKNFLPRAVLKTF